MYYCSQFFCSWYLSNSKIKSNGNNYQLQKKRKRRWKKSLLSRGTGL